MKKLICIVVLAILVSGCATQSQNIRYYEHHDKSQWLKESAAKLQHNLKEVPAIKSRRIMIRVFSWTEPPNAFVVFDNRNILISISDSLLPYLEKDNNIYCLLVHELAHVECNHTGKKAGLSSAISLVFIVADAALPGYGVGALDNIANPLIVNTYSRREELEADVKAIEYLAKMGISYKDFVIFLNLIKSIVPSSYQGGGILDTHPNFYERIQKVEEKGKSVQVVTPALMDLKEIENHNEITRAEIKKKFPFDIGPYGETKASKLAIGLLKKDVKNIFDGFKEDAKKILGKEKNILIYNIPNTEYRFAILFEKDSNNVDRVIDFTITSVSIQLLDETIFKKEGL